MPPAAARAVGMCLRLNSDIPSTPCHRVVAADGSLRGYSATGGLKQKQKMLLGEGVEFRMSKVDLSLSQWTFADK